MTTRTRRRDNPAPISTFRISVIIGIVGIAVIAIGLIFYVVFDRGSRQVPLDIAVYPNATQWGSIIPHTAYSRSIVYQVPNVTAEQVVQYYEQKLKDFYGSDAVPSELSCVRFPHSGNYLEFDQGQPGAAPYRFTCFFDRSYGDAIQWTRVNIQPGVFNTDPAKNSQGMTVIEHEQQWQP